MRSLVFILLLLQSNTLLASATACFSCGCAFSAGVLTLGRQAPVVETAHSIFAQRLSKEELYEKYVRDSLWDFDEFPYSLAGRANSEKPVDVKNGEWLRLLSRVSPGEWKKIYLELNDGREIHYYHNAEYDLVAFPKWKS